MALYSKQKWLPVKRAQTRLLDGYRFVALVVGPIHNCTTRSR